MLSALFLFSTVSVSFAADKDFNRYGVRIRGLYIIPNEHVDNALKPLGLVIDDAVAPELDLEYFFTKNISAELDLALSKHDIMADNGGVNVGSVWLLPPSLYVKYHPMPDAKISPYVGVGMNVVMPFDEKLTGVDDFKVESSVGWAAKIGADVAICKNTFLNVDAMYYDASTKLHALGSKFNLELKPFIISTGIGVRF